MAVTTVALPPKKRNKRKPPTERHRAVAEALAKGDDFKNAMITNGYSEFSARRGPKYWLNESPALKEAITERLGVVDPHTDEALIVQTLRSIVQHGEQEKTGQIAAAKLLGSHRKLQLWQPETVVGIFQNMAPEPAAQPYTPDEE